MKSSLSPQLILFGNPTVEAIPDLLDSIPEDTIAYFFSFLMKATRNGIEQITDIDLISKKVLLNPSLWYVEVKKEKIHETLRREEEITPSHLEYVQRAFSNELLARLARTDNPRARQEIFQKYSVS